MKSCLYNFDIEKVRVHRTTPARRSRAVQFWLTKFTLHRLYLSYLAQASFLQKNQPLQNVFLISVTLRWHRASVACKNQSN